jgi:hypothetical protein
MKAVWDLAHFVAETARARDALVAAEDGLARFGFVTDPAQP